MLNNRTTECTAHTAHFTLKCKSAKCKKFLLLNKTCKMTLPLNELQKTTMVVSITIRWSIYRRWKKRMIATNFIGTFVSMQWHNIENSRCLLSSQFFMKWLFRGREKKCHESTNEWSIRSEFVQHINNSRSSTHPIDRPSDVSMSIIQRIGYGIQIWFLNSIGIQSDGHK